MGLATEYGFHVIETRFRKHHRPTGESLVFSPPQLRPVPKQSLEWHGQSRPYESAISARLVEGAVAVDGLPFPNFVDRRTAASFGVSAERGRAARSPRAPEDVQNVPRRFPSSAANVTEAARRLWPRGRHRRRPRNARECLRRRPARDGGTADGGRSKAKVNSMRGEGK